MTTPLPIAETAFRPEYARGKQRQLVALPPDYERVPGVVPALKADHDVGATAQPVDNLPLAFIAPLGADDDNRGHGKRTALT